VELGLSAHQLAAAAGVSQQAVISEAIAGIEERRDQDPALDAALEAMAQDLRRQLGIGLAVPAANDNDRRGDLRRTSSSRSLPT
jgi:hypothetical protein